MDPASRGDTAKLTITSSSGTAACASVVSKGSAVSAVSDSSCTGVSPEHPKDGRSRAAHNRSRAVFLNIRMTEPLGAYIILSIE